MTDCLKSQKISVSANNLGCFRDQFPIFNEISFSLSAGEALFLRGANGSGKTSLLLVLAGILPYSGKFEIKRFGENQQDIPANQLIHFIGHQNAIKPELTLKQNLQFWAQMYNGDQTSISQILEKARLFGLDNFLAGHLSAGQKHRLSLCRLLLSPRPLWLLDEPTSTLDSQGDTWVSDLISSHLANAGIIIAATHRTIELKDQKKTKSLTMGANK
ncbi:MAG: heme ABC exporter ATP-binding protein CcmA [Devosiaceae bacterium]|nr:heme ABC exporter ATP-binding protein CcmA [Devosiaceae bacterium]